MGCGGRLFEAGRLLTFSAFRMGAYSRWALIRGWALIRINTVSTKLLKEEKSWKVLSTIFYSCLGNRSLAHLHIFVLFLESQ